MLLTTTLKSEATQTANHSRNKKTYTLPRPPVTGCSEDRGLEYDYQDTKRTRISLRDMLVVATLAILGFLL